MDKEYYLGLDIGTDSVGWAVTDTEYRIPKFRGNAMWGIRLFDESKTAEERRMFRTSRRRIQRRRERLNLLEMLFDEEISKKDIAFFQRLRESNLYLEDKTSAGKYCVFNDENYTDKDFHKEYPTVYHLRKELIENSTFHDARLVFIALHHIIKNRGHFLFDSLNADGVPDFAAVYDDFEMYLSDNYDIILNCGDVCSFSKILQNRNLNKTKKNAEISALFGVTKKSEPQICAILSLLSGSSVKLCDIFDDDSLKETEKKNITFSGGFDDAAPEYESILGERFELIEKLKAIYDWAVLADILNGEKYISFAKVKVYEQHHDDLKQLKGYVRERCPGKYGEIFKKSKSGLDNYVAYSGHVKKNGRTDVLNCKCKNQEDFCNYLKNLFSSDDKTGYEDMFVRIENGTFMPKQVNSDNGVIPMQIHRAELITILNNAKEYLPFISTVDESGKSVYEKIISLFDYRIPYYVGVLNTHSKNHWLVRSNEKIYPWNFSEVVDIDKSAEAFIENLTSKCSYLPEMDVIPKNSILYSKYTVLNELNNLKIDGEKITVELKQDIYNDLFMNFNKITNKRLRDYLHSKGYEFESISGIDGDFKSSLKPLRELAGYDLTAAEKEDIIKVITIFGDDKRLLKKRIRASYSDKLTETEMRAIFKLRYNGWSRLSKEFLTEVEVVDKATGEVVDIITALWQTNDNLMQLLYSENYEPDFNDAVKSLNSGKDTKSMREMVEELYVSPKVKRPIYQALLIAKEIEKIQKCAPKKIFVEVAKGEGKKERKLSRKSKLEALYKSCKNDYADLYNELLSRDEDELRSDKLYLYYTQFGKCMYSDDNIELGELMSNNSKYDIDHIFPRSMVKDDSLDNRVLVNKTINAGKSNSYPLSSEIQIKKKAFWYMLFSKGLISKKKYDRLVRKTPLTDDELSAFISRQLVETRQSTKAVAKTLEQLYPDTEIAYVKASLASEFRKKYDMLKCREVNDFHHAKDAYLNIVVGNVYNVRFTHDKRNFIKGLQQPGASGYSLNRMYDYNVKGAWTADNNESLELVKNTMSKNNIRYTRYAFKQQGGLFDQNIVKKGSGQVPIKANSARSDIEKYGGYNRASSKYFSLAKYADKKGKQIIQLVPIDAYREKDYLKNPSGFVSELLSVDAQIIIPRVKYNACLSFNGFRMHLSSKSGGGATLVYKPAVQLVVSAKEEKYIRNIVKYLKEFSKRKINELDNISRKENIALYDTLVLKLTETIFKVKFGDLGAKLKSKSEMFYALKPEEQCYIIAEILKIVHANVMSGDLTLLKEAKKSGIATTNSKISEIKNITSVKLINQSVTGLYEKEIELLK